MNDPLRVMVPHAFLNALEQVAREFEASGGPHADFAFGPATGDSHLSITSRLAQGEHADMVLLPTVLLQVQRHAGRVMPGSLEPVMLSGVGLCVKAGNVVPDVGSVKDLTTTLLATRSVAYSAAGSGDYVSQELFSLLGIADQMLGRGQRIVGEPVGAVVARGEACIGFQQLCELVPISGITVAGPLPQAVQRYTEISAAAVVGSPRAHATQQFVKFLTSSAGLTLRKAGLEPISHHPSGAA